MKDRRTPLLEMFTPGRSRRRSGLILPRFLRDEADKQFYRGARQDAGHHLLLHWADLERDGHLRGKKELELDAEFLQQVFGDALGYEQVTTNPDRYQLRRSFTVPGTGTADCALGNFSPSNPSSPLAVIELKGPDADLDRDKFNGRTPAQQCWDYLNNLPDCPWGIVSNVRTIRLYHRNKTQLAYEEFTLQSLRDVRRFRDLWCLLERGGLLGVNGQQPRALALLERTENRQREVGDELYAAYSDNRYQLIEHLHLERGKTLDLAIHTAQKILDRIVFVAFCEDRGLLPEKCIDKAYSTIPPFTKVTNPRWRNFLDLFHAVDRGHDQMLGLDEGYNGGLFRHDDEVDNLELDDQWTNFFRSVGRYDFRDEVNVQVLGHFFEQSIAEIEKMRLGGMLEAGGNGNGAAPPPAMRKSAERKRFGTYYTPAEFTRFIVANTVETLILDRLEALKARHSIAAPFDAIEPSPEAACFWRETLDVLRQLKVCDPACGSGAFLIQAYDLLEDWYGLVVAQLELCGEQDVDTLADQISDWILGENLYGVDVSPQSVEITQLALWIRSARKGRTLADLSGNILCANSLVDDARVHPRAMVWQDSFPAVFGREGEAGFDCVIGNPPWERMKLQEREFFAFSAPRIAGAVSAAGRRKLIAELETTNPELFQRYQEAKQAADGTLEHVRAGERFPLTAKGDVNTYMVFAELARQIVAPHGRVGLLVPSGIATDKTTKEFFADLIESRALISLYDFENRKRIFPDVDSRFKFSILLFGGSGSRFDQSGFAFFLHRMEDLDDPQRHIRLSRKDLKLLNPNTRTCPIFRTRRDAELTKTVYRRVPVLWDRGRRKGGNPWGVKFHTMFHQTNDAERFIEDEQLKKQGFKLQGNRWTKGRETYLPLYEAKMVQAYDHRAAGVVVAPGNWVRQGQTEATTLADHQNPEFTVQPRWWVSEAEVLERLGTGSTPGFLGFKDITSATNQRTMIAAAIPWCAVTNHFPLILSNQPHRLQACLLANLNSFAFDYVTRQKIGGVTLNFFIIEQLPLFAPEEYSQRCPWNQRTTLQKWISDRVLKLTCTADDMIPLARAAGLKPHVNRWNEAQRAKLMAELDAAFFLLYGIGRGDVEYILGTFAGAGERSDQSILFRTDESILEAYGKLGGKAQ